MTQRELDSKALDKAYAVFIKVWMKASTITALNDAVAAYLSALPALATQEVDELREAHSSKLRLTIEPILYEPRDGGIADVVSAAYIDAMTQLDQLREDAARLDWLEMQSVKVPSNFWAFPPGGGTARPSDLRAQIDRARAAEKDKG